MRNFARTHSPYYFSARRFQWSIGGNRFSHGDIGFIGIILVVLPDLLLVGRILDATGRTTAAPKEVDRQEARRLRNASVNATAATD